MKRLALCFLATAFAAPAAAFAQGYPMPPPPGAVAAEVGVAHARARYRDYRRLERGGMVPNYWWGPAFMVGDWAGYGLYQPQAGYRWIRYYDDALLIDPYGRVLDGRYDMDWSTFAGWGYDAHGIPIFADVRTEGYGLEHHGGYANPGYANPGYPYPGYGQSYGSGYGYGDYGYGQAGGWVTETTVTRDCAGAAPMIAPPPPPPPPPPGERG